MNSSIKETMHKAMICCNDVQTQVITEGRWIEESFPQSGNKNVVIVIPGNPGIPLFYKDFIKSLSSKLPPETPIWAVGHAGHVQPPKGLEIAMPSEREWNKYYGLNAQVEHKVQFIKKYVPDDARIYLIGHSIGSWVILNLLKNEDISKRVEKCYLLFPTIENIADTPNGRFLIGFVFYLTTILLYMSWIFTMFPYCLQAFLIRVFGIFYGIPAKSIDPIILLLQPLALGRVFKLAREEMIKVKELDDDVISQYGHKLWLYYGATDNWTPLSHYENMRSKHPNVEAQLCKRGFSHCFVWKDDKELGKIVGDMINESMSKT
ncbi:hypothetical protein KPH14_006803 [Odynerus spinipes]|uniref:Lipid droplet-associated hydrolase n=1 Tax=Odynerus spinipes TaxID=1348599 RepID=A0AAD9RR61_9HYME|nr:hypothetical protein KPH14_006803 [Odynerus spinipes]